MKLEEKKLALRKKILESAKEVFLEKRYSSVTTDEIAEHAGITKRTLYKYFPSKLALFINMYDDYLQKLGADMAATAKIKVPSNDIIIMLWDVFFNFTKSNEKFMRLYWMLDSDEFEGELPKELIDYVKKHISNVFKTLVPVYDKMRNEGRIMDVDPMLLMHLISAINKGIFIQVSKERRFNVADLSADDLNGLMKIILRDGLFRSSSSSLTRKT